MTLLRQLDRSPGQKCLAVVFALAMLGIGFVQAVHVHDDLARQSTPPSHCSLCVAAHNPVAVVSTGGAPLPVVESAPVLPAETPREAFLSIGAAFIRPPPQVL